MNRLVVLIVLVPAICSGDSHSELMHRAEFEEALDQIDCQHVWADHSISLRVLGFSFPLPDDFNFVGVDDGLPKFVSAGKVNDVSKASVAYFEPASIDEANDELPREFDDFFWRGMNLYFRASLMGYLEKIGNYQVVIRSDQRIEELIITSPDPLQIAGMISCARPL